LISCKNYSGKVIIVKPDVFNSQRLQVSTANVIHIA